MTKTFYPKGGMCCACKHFQRGCSHLDFKTMPVISRRDNEHIVRCTDFSRSQSSNTKGADTCN